MIANLKPYPVMKDSGLPWLGDVPSTWTIKRNGSLFAQRNEKRFGDLPLLEVSLKTGVRVREMNGSGRKQMMSDRDQYKRARKGDLAYNMMRMWQGAIGMVPIDGLVSPAYVVARPFNGIDARFFEYLFRTDAYMGEVDKFSRGIVKDRNRLYWEDFKRIPSPVPPPEEQAAIVRLLDHADTQIRRCVHAKKNLIRLLTEEKEALIHRVVTCGLDPCARLKRSGVQWLGDVPQRWEVMTLAQIIADGPKNGISPPIDEQGMVRSFSISAVRDGKVEVRPEDMKSIAGNKDALEHVYSLLRDDVLLIRGNGNIRLVGRCGVVEDDMPGCVYPDLLMRIRVTARCLPQYLVAVLNSPSSRDQIETAARTAVGTFKVNNQQIRQLYLALPPVAEQRRVLDWLAKELGPTTAAVHCAENEITLLREYRMRLIADVVTGKVDVREVRVGPSNEIEEPQGLEDIGVETDEEAVSADDLADSSEEAET